MFLERVINTLDSHGVPYLLVGGHAVALHGAVRGTVDVDIAVPLSKQAYVKAEQALRDIGLKPRLPVGAEEMFDSRESYIKDKNLVAWSFCNPGNPLEMVDIIVTVDASLLKPATKRSGSLQVRIVALDDLIKLKQEAGRKQDLEDVRALRKLQ